jgi:hypothetical protein
MERLFEILSLKRGHQSVGERKFVDNILGQYPVTKLYDPQGEVLAYMLASKEHSDILWSCHIDTVHAPTDDAKQVVIWDKGMDMMYKQDGKPLGADDGAGVWLMLEMYDTGVPGTYLFHRGEERGGIGSTGMAKYHPEFIADHNYAIAFDRRDTCSVITHQSSGRCCSNLFAEELAARIMGKDKRFELKPDDGGIYTDTAEYTKLIPECTNVSIGYYNEHGGSEMLDLSYLSWLRDRLCSIDLTKLPIVRKTTDVESKWGDWGWGTDFLYAPPKASKKSKKLQLVEENPTCAEEIVEMRWRDVVKWVERTAPEDVADLLMNMAEDLVYNTDSFGEEYVK